MVFMAVSFAEGFSVKRPYFGGSGYLLSSIYYFGFSLLGTGYIYSFGLLLVATYI
jgi:hypothetical protein